MRSARQRTSHNFVTHLLATAARFAADRRSAQIVPALQDTTMRQILVLLAIASALGGTVFEAQASEGARLTVARLLSLYDGEPVSPPLPDWPASVPARLAREQAELYIAAVIDEGESHRWCVAARNLPPHERDALLVTRLRTNAYAQQPNAARTLAALLSSDFPCSKPQRAKRHTP
ncbi:MAG: hypothetical protein JWL63_1571 [Rhodocyclales bacterium]|nr:hypothetical protein [Rhodocyclales bacterium]